MIILLIAALAQPEATALFITAKKGASITLVDAVRRSAALAASTALTDAVVSDAKILARLKDPEKQLDKCGADLKCIAKIGKKIGASRVVYGRVVPAGNEGVQVQLLLISVKSKAIEQRAQFELQSLDDVKHKLPSQLYGILSINGPGQIAVAGVNAEVLIDGRSVGMAPAEFSVSAGRHEVTVLGISATVVVLPGATERLNITPPAPASEPASQIVVIAAAPAEAETPPPAALVMPAKKRGLTWMTPTGASVAAAGLVTVAVGIYFGVAAARASAQIVPPATTQLDAARLQREAGASAAAANVCFGLGAGALALGAGVLVADLILSKREITPVMTVTEHGVFGGVHAAF